MAPVTHGTRSAGSLAGLMAYVTHDKGGTSADRVAWTEGVNLPVNDAASCEKLMSRTVADAEHLKAAAGLATQGRKLRKPFSHDSLSWSKGEHPTRNEMRTAAVEYLHARGYGKCQAFIARHDDTDHPHVHIVICRVDPQTGRATKPTHTRKIQAWAEKYEEKTHAGRLVIPNRRARRLVREHNAGEIRAALKENREPVLRAMPRMKPRPVRDALGRVTAPRTDEERSAFNELNAAHRQDGTPPAEARHDRVALARTQAEARVQAKRDRVSRALRTATRPPTQAPARVNPRPPVDVLPPRTIFVVRDSSRTPDPPMPVRAAPDREALTARTFVVREQSTAPDPPTPVRAPPDRTPSAIAVRADSPTPPPAPSRPIEGRPRPTSTHDSKPVTRGADRQIGGAPAPSTRPPKAPERP